MANAIKWEAAFTDRGTVLGTELNALADNARSAPGTEIDNSINLDQYGQLELTVDFVSAPSSGAYCEIYLVKAPDGTNYEDGSASVDPGASNLVAVIPINAVTTAQRRSSRIFELPPCKLKFLLTDRTGQLFPASGSVLKLFTCADEVQ